MNRHRTLRSTAAAGLAVAAVLLCSCSPTPRASVADATTAHQYSSAARVRGAATTGAAAVRGTLRAAGGPYLTDSSGRVVLLHGVDAVYKHPPYVLYADPGKPWNFDAADARRIAGLGFDVVRLGILWAGLEPGHGGPNDPAVCTPGRPGDPHMFVAAVADAYLAKVARTVDLLGRYHVYTLLDMHQDVYNTAFRGEGAPTWAVCTDGQPVVPVGGRWSRNYADPTLAVALDHFWRNDVAGDLQGQFDLVWATVARYFAHNPWVVGYDPYNEPFSVEHTESDRQAFATALECFYTGRRHPGSLAGGRRVHCPADDPAVGVVPAIERADPRHLVFVEPDIYAHRHGAPDLLGPMDLPRLVFNFHVYCPDRNPVTGEPTDVTACESDELAALARHEEQRAALSSPRQPGGPAVFMSEFGASHDATLLEHTVADANLFEVGWAYWSWKYYDDPTGSADEALVSPSGALEPSASALSVTYAQAVAGSPVTTTLTPATGRFELLYTPSARSSAPTVVFVPGTARYPNGYCTTVSGGTVASAPGARRLLVRADPGADRVDVVVAAGRCAP